MLPLDAPPRIRWKYDNEYDDWLFVPLAFFPLPTAPARLAVGLGLEAPFLVILPDSPRFLGSPALSYELRRLTSLLSTNNKDVLTVPLVPGFMDI